MAGGRNNLAGGGAALPEPNTTYLNNGAYASVAGGRNNVATGTWAAISGGAYYTLANATDVFNDLKNLQRVPLDQPCPPVMVWNQELLYTLMMFLLLAEWLLRKRERLL